MADQANAIRLGCFVVTYERPDVLRRTLERILEQTTPPLVLAVVDNADDAETAEVVAELAEHGVRYLPTGENLGSAGGAAFGFRTLLDDDVDWIVSVDDDDPPQTADTFERLAALIARQEPHGAGVVGAFGARWDWNTGEHERVPDEELVGDVDIDVIGGNALLTVSRTVLEDVGPPKKEFFFGHWDPLYCLTVKAAGHRVVVDGDLMLDYRRSAGRIGLTQPKRFAVPPYPMHALWRRYYVTRNYVFAMRRTFGRPDLARRYALRALARTSTALTHGPRYAWRYLWMQCRGIVDGCRGRLGRTVSPVVKPQHRRATEAAVR